MHVKIHTAAVPDGTTSISNDALELVRGFLPPERQGQDLGEVAATIGRVKALAAALISECELIRDARGKGARDAAIAITQIQGATFFAVSAATAEA